MPLGPESAPLWCWFSVCPLVEVFAYIPACIMRSLALSPQSLQLMTREVEKSPLSLNKAVLLCLLFDSICLGSDLHSYIVMIAK